jgi:hypothetical protein
MILPRRRHIKDRAVSDYTYSEHAEGWDDCLEEVMQLLDLYGIPFDEPRRCTKESLKDGGIAGD